jgi:hypothetical protein
LKNKATDLPFSLIEKRFKGVTTRTDQGKKPRSKSKAYSLDITRLSALAPTKDHRATSSFILATIMITVDEWRSKDMIVSLLPNFPRHKHN